MGQALNIETWDWTRADGLGLFARKEDFMALTRDKKIEIIDQIVDQLAESKLTVVADYRGLTVAQSQDLRRRATANGSRVMVAKNRLVKQALTRKPELAQTPTESLDGMLIYVFNPTDEVAPAQTIKNFCDQTGAELTIVGAISPQGEFLDREVVDRYASLQGREQLLAELLLRLQSQLFQIQAGLQAPAQKVIAALAARK